MQLIERAFTDLDAEVHIAAHANDILLKSPRATIYSRLVEGRFPKWRDVIPGRREAVQINWLSDRCFAPCGRRRSSPATKVAASISLSAKEHWS